MGASELAERARAMPGLEFLEAIRDGELPAAPIQDLMGFQLVKVEEGRGSHGPPSTRSQTQRVPMTVTTWTTSSTT